jgi:hypothetical protein
VEAVVVLADSAPEQVKALRLEQNTQLRLALVALVELLHQHQAFQEVILYLVRLPLLVAVAVEMKQKMALLVVLVVVVVELLVLKPAAQVILQALLLHKVMLEETMLRQVISLPVVEEERVRQAKRHQPIQAATVVMGHLQVFLAHP